VFLLIEMKLIASKNTLMLHVFCFNLKIKYVFFLSVLVGPRVRHLALIQKVLISIPSHIYWNFSPNGFKISSLPEL
jgi:hypothetical protein